MNFLNHLSNRVALALIGGILYSLLTIYLLALLDIPRPFRFIISGFVFLFYFGSRLLLLFSGIHTIYYSKGKNLKKFYEGTSFDRTAQWVGKFYYYHDLTFLGLLIIICLVFIVSLIFDLHNHQPLGNTFQTYIEFFSF